MGLWVAASDRAEEGDWVWPDGYPLKQANWAMGEPNDHGEDCAAMNWHGP